MAIGESSAGGEGGDAGLVAEGGEVVDAGQAHDLPPALALVRGLGLGVRAACGRRALAHVGQALQHPRAQAARRRVFGGGHRGVLLRCVSAWVSAITRTAAPAYAESDARAHG